MIQAVEFAGKIYQATPYHAVLPLYTRSGAIKEISWGWLDKRKEEDLPRGYAVPLGLVRSGAWDARQQRPVKVAAQRFLMAQVGFEPTWFDVRPHECIHGLVMRLYNRDDDLDLRAFIVTIGRDPYDRHPFHRIPRVIPRQAIIPPPSIHK